MNRRSALTTGLGLAIGAGAVAIGARTGRLDDIADSLGIEPRRLPAESDAALVDAVARDLSGLIDVTERVVERFGGQQLKAAIGRCRVQLAALGANPSSSTSGVRDRAFSPDDGDQAATLDALAARYQSAARDHGGSAMKALSGRLALALASISAGLAQTAADLSAPRFAMAPLHSDKSGGTVDVAALQRCLAHEHEAMYVFAYIGGRLKAGTPVQRRATASYRLHHRQREALRAAVDVAGAVPIATEVAYPVADIADTRAATKQGRRVEQRGAALYADVIATTDGADRALAIARLQRCALDLLAWGDSPAPFPGTAPAPPLSDSHGPV